MHAKCKGRDLNAIKGNYRGLHAKSWQNTMQQDKCMQKCGCNRVWGQQGPKVVLNKRQACNKAIKGPTCSFKNMWDLNTMQKKHTSMQSIEVRINM